ncbi:MAG: histidine phosphatase family protein [Vicinamibacterales bacterium]
MRLTSFALLIALVSPVWANDAVWQKLKTESDLVVFMRHTQPAGGNPLAWDKSGNCEGESMLTPDGKAHAKRIGKAFSEHGIKPIVISSPMCRCRDTAEIAFGAKPLTDGNLREVASADSAAMKSFERAAQALISTRRGPVPVVFVSHRPNIDLLTMELIDSGELLVGRASAKGEIDVLGKINIP